jgi:hypothetical protein
MIPVGWIAFSFQLHATNYLKSYSRILVQFMSLLKFILVLQGRGELRSGKEYVIDMGIICQGPLPASNQLEAHMMIY